MRMPFKSTREQVVFVPAAYISSDLQALQEASENGDDGAKDAINGWRVGGVSAIEQGYHTADEYADPNRTIEVNVTAALEFLALGDIVSAYESRTGFQLEDAPGFARGLWREVILSPSPKDVNLQVSFEVGCDKVATPKFFKLLS